MNSVYSRKGITLISLVLTMIILLILVGVVLQIINESIVDKAEIASAKTIEVSTKEKVQFVLSEYQIEKYSTNNSNYDLRQNLENIDGVKNVSIIENNSDNSDYVEIEYNDCKNAFKIMQNEIKETDLLLKKNVKIGDYIQYSKNYTDVYTDATYDATNGWRILDDGTISGNVRIISSGIPAKWGYDSTVYETNDEAIQELLNCFNNNQAVGSNRKIIIKESNIKDENFAESVTVLTLKDLNLAYNIMHNSERIENSIDNLSTNDDLFNLRNPGISYWIAPNSNETEANLYFLNLNTEIKSIDWLKTINLTSLKAGVRPVVTLKEGLAGKFENNIWKIN